MKRFLTLALAGLVTTTALAQTQTKPEPAKADVTKSKTVALMQGTWVLTTADGQDLTGAPEITVTITGDKYVQTTAGTVVERGSFKIDETKKPMTMDLIISEGDSAGKTQLGVVEVTDKTMTGKLNQPGESGRPTDLAPADGFFAFTAKKR